MLLLHLFLAAAVTLALATPPLPRIISQAELFASLRKRHSHQLEEAKGAGAGSVDSALWPIYFHSVVPEGFDPGQKYHVDPVWSKKHTTQSEKIDLTNDNLSEGAEYAVFRCQYSCQGNPRCLGFFATFVDETRKRCECHEYDEQLTPSLYVKDETTPTIGGYNK